VTLYYNAYDVTVANSNHKIFLFFCCACAPHFEKGSATHDDGHTSAATLTPRASPESSIYIVER